MKRREETTKNVNWWFKSTVLVKLNSVSSINYLSTTLSLHLNCTVPCLIFSFYVSLIFFHFYFSKGGLPRGSPPEFLLSLDHSRTWGTQYFAMHAGEGIRPSALCAGAYRSVQCYAVISYNYFKRCARFEGISGQVDPTEWIHLNGSFWWFSYMHQCCWHVFYAQQILSLIHI